MYKRLAATALLVLALWSAPPLFAQYSSFLYRSSFGLFDTPLDAATTTREMGMLNTFSELAQRYVFGDLTNFASLATGGNVSTPFTFGVYRPGSSASSLVVGLMVDTTPSGALNGVDPASIVVAPVLKPVGTTDYPWIERSDRNTYAFIDAWDISASGQALMHFGTANAGIAFSGGFLQNSGGLPINTWTGNNVTTVRSFYYDAAAIDAAPNPATNYTLTISRSEPDTSVSVSLNIPVYLSLGKLGLQLTPGGSFQYADTSYTNRQTYSAPAQAAPGTFPNVLTLSSLIRKDAAASGGISGTLFLPSLFGKHPRNTFQIGLSGRIDYGWAFPLEQSIVLQDFSYAGSGAVLQLTNLGSTAEISNSTTFSGALNYHLLPTFTQTLYFDLANSATLAFGPTFGISLDTEGSPVQTQQITVQKADGSGDGLYNNVLDTVTTQTITYSNNVATKLIVAPRFSLPAAVTYHPAGLPFGVSAGANASINYAASFISSPTEVSRIVTHVVDGTGAQVGTDSTIAPLPALTQTSFTSAWTISTELRLCISWYLPKDGTIDIVIKGAIPGDLFEVQAIIPLP